MSKTSPRIQWILGIGIIAIVSVIALPSRTGKAGSPNLTLAIAPHLTNSGSTEIGAQESDFIAAQRKRSAQLHWGRNPFRLPEEFIPEPKAQVQQVIEDVPQLSGISTINNAKMAIIDHQIVSQGDLLKSGHLVVTVSDRVVELLRDGQKTTLTLGN